MRRTRRTVSIFSLSALDLFAMTMGCFVLLVVVLMPYYRLFNDARAEIDAVRESTETLQAELDTLNRRAAANDAAASEDARKARALAERAAALAGEAEAKRVEARLAEEEAGTTDQQVAMLKAITRRTVEPEMDLVFVIDTTGSMEFVLRDLGRSLASIVRILRRLVPSLRVGFVAYQDRDTGAYVTRPFPLTTTNPRGLAALERFAGDLRPAPGSGRTPTEAVLAGLREAFAMSFRPSAKQQLILIGDARPHPEEIEEAMRLSRRFVGGSDKRGISSLFVTTRSFLRYGNGDDAWFRALAREGRGEFVDHRGRMIESVLLSVLER